jgi:hypothetical protein
MSNAHTDSMRPNHRILLVGGGCVVAAGLSVSMARAQTVSTPAIPAVLRVDNKSPQLSPEARKQIGRWVYSLALQAATYAVPINAMYLLRDTTSTSPNAKPAPREIWKM